MDILEQFEKEVERLRKEYSTAERLWFSAESPTAAASQMFSPEPYEGPEPVELKERLEEAEQNLSYIRAAFIAHRGSIQALLEEPRTSVAVSAVISTIAKLSPELIGHLKRQEEDLDHLAWETFEHLIAEFLAAKGFSDVRLVGRDARTSADIFALYHIPGVGTNLRFFIEVKRTRGQIGIGTINAVLGALIAERPRHGWHIAHLISTGGYADFKKTTPLRLSLAGLELKDRSDVLAMLREYSPSSTGLWLPNPSRRLP